MTRRVITVPSRARWTDAGLSVRTGDRLEITASGQWTDWTIVCGPAGFSRRHLAPFERLRRAPAAPWFGLMAALDKDPDTQTYIGEAAVFVAPRDGRLYFFANDVPVMYWNNSGAVQAAIRIL